MPVGERKLRPLSIVFRKVIVQDHIQKLFMSSDPPVVFRRTQFPSAIHQEAHSEAIIPSCPPGSPVRSWKMSVSGSPGMPNFTISSGVRARRFAGNKEPVDKVGLSPYAPGQQELQK